MRAATFSSFKDELIKIAGVVDYLKAGWHGTEQTPNTWMGQGAQVKPRPAMITPANGGKPWMGREQVGRVGKAFENVTSLGGLTKALPVGAKTMMLLGTGAMASQALKKEDPSGQGQSRLQRVSRLAGNTLGGLAGAGIAAKHFPGSGILAPIIGGVGGSIVGEKLTSLPFRHPAPQPAGYAPQGYYGEPVQ